MRVATELRYAIYTALFSFVWLVVEYATGLQDRLIEYNALVRWFALFIPALLYYAGLKQKLYDNQDGVFGFARCLVSGLIITVIATLLFVPLQTLFHLFIHPAFFDNMIQHDVQQAVYNGRNPKAAYDAAKAVYNTKAYAVQTAVGMLVYGTVLSLLLAMWFTRNRTVVNSSTEPTTVQPTD